MAEGRQRLYQATQGEKGTKKPDGIDRVGREENGEKTKFIRWTTPIGEGALE